jgi:hypothetical protein
VFTTAHIPGHVASALGKSKVHRALAATLALDAANRNSAWAEWKAVWPSRSAFEETHPLLWRRELQELLPPAAKGCLIPSLFESPELRIVPTPPYQYQLLQSSKKKKKLR